MESKTLTLISSDGHEFEVSESVAALSVTIKNMVDDGCSDKPIPILNVDAKTLSKVIGYIKDHAADKGFVVSDDEDFDDLLDCLLAANYLNIGDLLRLLSKKISDLIANKSTEEIRELFELENDFTKEEEEEARNNFAWAFQ
ncbi:hypothetical protein C2S51_017349 [Perilla frutescens var. frutescens]|nr:hypothetical protein C2S51_017349 [Perilla frutescens var. frutescens]